MKTKLLFITMIALAVIFSTQAQTIGGEDLKIFEKEKKFELKPRISIADNGWIYILCPFRNDDNTISGATGFKVLRSTDGGKTYKDVIYNVNQNFTIINDVDMAVSGSGADINIWIAMVINYTSGDKKGGVYINKYDANGENKTSVYAKAHYSVLRNHVAISTSYRSPGADTDPFGIAVAVTGYDNNSKAFVEFIYSKDAGANFTLNSFSAGSTDVGKVDVSLGACKIGESSHTLAGIVFEKDFGSNTYGNIGFVSINPGTSQISNVINVNTNYGSDPYYKQCWYPNIQYMSNKNSQPMLGNGFQSHNFVITYNRLNDKTNEIVFVIPKSSFDIKNNLTYNDLFRHHLSKDGYHLYDASLSYNKMFNFNHYLLTYVARKKNTSQFEFHYRFFRYNEIDKSDLWMTINDGIYSKYNFALIGIGNKPVLDINPQKTKAHFAWVTLDSKNAYVWTDFEDSTLDNPEITTSEKELKLHPNPAIDKVTLELLTQGDFTASLSDLQGRQIKSFVFSGTQYSLNISDLPAGVYLFSVKSDSHKHYVQKLVKK